MAAAGGSGRHGELGLTLGAGRGVAGEGGDSFAKPKEGRRASEVRKQAGNWRTARLGVFVAVAR
jgi:hypothetical protein